MAERYLDFILLSLFVLVGCDVILTQTLIEQYNYYEVNPIAEYIINHTGYIGLYIFKISFVIILYILSYNYYTIVYKYISLLIITTIVYLTVVIWEIVCLI